MDSKAFTFIKAVRSVLRYHQTIGIGQYPSDDALSSFLQTASVPSVSASGDLEKSRALSTRVETSPSNKTIETCADIAGEVRNCTGCVLHTKRWSTIAERGGEDKPKLFIVGGWFRGEQDPLLPLQSVFGIEEDRMVSRMLTAMHLAPEQAFVTNIIKCAIPGDCEPSSDNIQSCFSFLQRQIQVLHPVVICAMGITAARALLKSTQPLSALRGKMYSYSISEQEAIPVIPTYHPTFLLKNQEFKKATWEDLQLVSKYLRSQGVISS